MSKKDELSPKHRRFVAEYIKDQNASQACIRSGYSKKNPNVVGPRLLANVGIRAAIDALLSRVEEKAIVDKVYVLTNLKKVTERCMTEEPVMEFDYEEKTMVEKKTYIEDPDNPGKMKQVGIFEFDSAGANGALKMLGQHLKMFTDKVEHEVGDGFAAYLEEAIRRGNAIRRRQ